MIGSKPCSRCGIEKSLDEFSSHKQTRDGKQSWCKECNNIAAKEYRKKYPWKVAFQDIKKRCNNPKNKAYKTYGGRGIKFVITVDQLKFLWFRDNASDMKCATIDRKNNDGNYCLDNCRFIELRENSARKDPKYCEKQVNQYSLDGVFIKTWKSGHAIQRNLGFAQSNISEVCSGKRKTAYKYKWVYKND